MAMNVRAVRPDVAVIDITGELNGAVEAALMAAYAQATQQPRQAIILNFQKLGYMNSSGIGLLVTLLVRVQRQQQRLLAYGLTDHYQQIFALTRLNEAIAIYQEETEALAALG